jgi:hypothetical protein
MEMWKFSMKQYPWLGKGQFSVHLATVAGRIVLKDLCSFSKSDAK